ncbi:unnamed protein product [Ilex paraguariensis]|uniref:Cytochrome b561 and DOMON domain-containing protein n=1 Tax=Ilex paraguariensis TaxID=185542 RepID=A0ABC8QL39_9AQUA
MDKFFKTILFLCLLVSVFISSSAQSCSNYRFSNNNLNYSTCTDLPQLNAFLHWNYHQANHTVDIAYRHTGATSGRWIAWALNINGNGMLGAQCLVAFTNSSSLVHAYTSPIGTGSSDYGTSLAQGPLSFNVPSIRAVSTSNEMTIFATLELPSGRTSFNNVWQEGPLSGDTPAAHSTSSANENSFGRVDFATGEAGSGGGATIPRLKKKNIHGVLNVVGWGIMMPVGAIIARYLKVFKSADPAWFYLHVACQSSAYVIGVAGWATGIKLGSDSPTFKYNTHRNIGIVLFCLGTLQVPSSSTWMVSVMTS